ncbi:MAG: DUF5655 domain-containing protein [Hafnia sp.]
MLDNWDEKAIISRAKKMAEKAAEVWPTASLSLEILHRYKPQHEENITYSFEDHPYLAKEHVNSLFEAFRKEVLALDPCVTEVFLKLYIAYKAEVNFVDVVPQAKRLRLSLNIPFAEINDPRGLCKDVTNLGRWGNGDVEVGLEALSDLPYVMTLVTQAFERQMDN